MAQVKIRDKGVRKLISSMAKRHKKITKRDKDYAALVGASIFADIMDHFDKERGPTSPWDPWSERYLKFLIRQGKSGNKILHDSGDLRKGWIPMEYRTFKEGIAWFNPVEYAGKHDRGEGGVPKREFTWLSRKAIRKIESETVKFMLEDEPPPHEWPGPG